LNHAIFGKVIAGGSFLLANGTSWWHLARFNADGSLGTAWNPRPDDDVHVVIVSGTNIYAGGEFHSIGGRAQPHLAKLDYATGAADPAWNPGADEVVRELAIQGNYLYAAGAFTNIGGLARTYVARLDLADGAADPAWTVNLDHDVSAMAVNASHVTWPVRSPR
jgi:hypothetical protein